MPWVRIDEHAMEHPKVAGLPDGAFRLWVTGLSYCQKFLTDGFISDVAQRGLRAFSQKRRDELVTARLWDAIESGVHVHDYLIWNASREHVLNSREQARNRLRKHKDKRVSNDVVNAHPTVTCVEDLDLRRSVEGGAGETRPREDEVGRFVDRYQELHEQYRGVAYLGNPQKDYQAACEMVAAFGYARCEAIAVYGLNDPDPFMRKSTVTIPMLKSRASKYAEELKAKKLA
jgi:hypothetical protein